MRIGILARPDVSRSGNQVWIVNDEIRTIILKYHAEPVIITPPLTNYQSDMPEEHWEFMKTLINSCDGFILQGGDDYYKYDLKVVNYLLEADVPVLGICLGMQTVGCLLGGKLKKIEKFHMEHYQPNVEYVHLVTIIPGTKLHSILKTDTIKVNSRHKECLVQTKAKVSAASSDDVIEAIEIPDKSFFIGVQWHPESMIEYDKVSHLLFDAFFQEVGKKYEGKRTSGGAGGN